MTIAKGKTLLDDFLSDSPWHMTIGGYNNGSALDSVELYNWETGQRCFIEPLPQVNFNMKFHPGQLC